MKTFFLFVLILVVGKTSYSQIIINESPKSRKEKVYINIDTLKVDYLQVLSYQISVGYGVHAEVDYGQPKRAFKKKSAVLNADKKKMVFNSEAAIINYFSKNGWMLISYDYQVMTFRRSEKK
ncbi:MAG: hypothetical protein CL840_10740 [Crocinitomicaceae bacterium]|nr:hypothetical protein [Crocinitomicaceae bacterium]|tara:strand:- start:35551 stop:35916 length:366 start_codon:yes stop_codon:yes gene_type:complete